LMYDPPAAGYFERPAQHSVRAGANLLEALTMGITGVRTAAEADGIDMAWRDAFAAGRWAGPRVKCAGPALRTTGGHGTAYPREYVNASPFIVADGPTQLRTAVRSLAEQGADWVKILLTGGLYSVHETVDSGQFADDELEMVMATARQRGLPVLAHCGSARLARHVVGADGGGDPRHRDDESRRLAGARGEARGGLGAQACPGGAGVRRGRGEDRDRRRPQSHRTAPAC